MKYGRYGWYCDCKFSFGLEICGHKMKESDLDDLLTKGKTKTYSFKSKNGNSFKAKIVVNKTEHKTGFEFVNDKNKSSNSAKSTASSWNRRTTEPKVKGWGKK